MSANIIVVIPARMASSRFPGKPLVKITNLPMVEHIRRRALLAKGVSQVVVATCDQEIVDVVEAAGGKAVMTSDKHERASERVAEAMGGLSGDIVVILQGDEPLVLPEVVDVVTAPFFEQEDLVCVSLISPLENEADFTNPNIVKAACDQLGNILYFSRAPIPYFQQPGSPPIFRETGIRAFRADFLQIYSHLPETPFERVESVDMMRLLEHGYRIFGVATDYVTIGVDHPQDIEIVENILNIDPNQKSMDDYCIGSMKGGLQ